MTEQTQGGDPVQTDLAKLAEAAQSAKPVKAPETPAVDPAAQADAQKAATVDPAAADLNTPAEDEFPVEPVENDDTPHPALRGVAAGPKNPSRLAENDEALREQHLKA